MKQKCSVLFVVHLLSSVLIYSSALAESGGKAPIQDKRILEAYARRPLVFEVNRGQTDEKVQFISHGKNSALFLSSSEAVLALHKPVTNRGEMKNRTSLPRDIKETRGAVLRWKLVGANRSPDVVGAEELPGKVNYFIGDDMTKWRANVPTYAKVHYRDVYPGVDMIYHGLQRQLEYDFIVAPGTDPGVVAMRIEGSETITLNRRGDLVLEMEEGQVVMRKPDLYQEINGARHPVKGRYVLRDNDEVGFQVGDYDVTRPLVIDPVLLYSTYLGGNGADLATGIAADSSGNAYVTGWILSTNFPTKIPLQAAYGGGNFDSFVTKLDPAGALVYSTYLGGSGADYGAAIALDGPGNAYITGYTTSTNFPTAGGSAVSPLNATLGGNGDAFVTKLNPAGNNLVYSTLLGGSQGDVGAGITVNGANAYVTGYTDSADFPTAGGPIVSPLQASYSGSRDAFVAKFDLTGKALVYSTFIGGNAYDFAYAIAVDGPGHAYVTGITDSPNFPTVGAYDASYSGGGTHDAFVAKLNPAGNAVLYSTYLGGNANDWALAIALDTSGNAYITGYTGANFPTKSPLQASLVGNSDAFVSKIDPAQSGPASLVYSTYFGGNGQDSGYGIALDSLGNAWITGVTFSTNLPSLNPIQASLQVPGDVFITALNPTGNALVFSTYLGGSGDDWGQAIALDGAGNAYVAGLTTSTNFPTLNAAQPITGGSRDAVVVKISGVVPLPPPCVDPPNTTMVAWYPFDEAAGTGAANLATANHAVLNNSPAHVPGKVARALRFDGINDYAESRSSIVTNIGPAGLPQTCGGGYSTCRGDFSIDAWINLDPSASTGVVTIADKRSGNPPAIRGYTFFVLGRNRLGIQLADGAGTGYSNYLSPVITTGLTNGWHHVAVTVSRRTAIQGIKWFDNGVQIGSSNPTLGPSRFGSLVNNSPLRMGGDNYSTAWFKGDIDELEIFNRQLTPAEVQGIYKAGMSGKCK